MSTEQCDACGQNIEHTEGYGCAYHNDTVCGDCSTPCCVCEDGVCYSTGNGKGCGTQCGKCEKIACKKHWSKYDHVDYIVCDNCA